MCKRVSLLWDLDKKTTKEITTFLKKSYRIYYLLLITSLINTIFSYYKNHLYQGIYDSITVILFILFIYIFKKLTINPETKLEKDEITSADIPAIHHAIGVVMVLIILYLFNIAYGVLTTFNYLIFLNLISVLIQISTLYILYKFLKKVEATEFLIQDEEAV